MLLHRLRRFAAFSQLSPADLARVANRVRVLSLPAGRWLVRPGRELAGSYYLDRGRVRLYEPDEVVDAGSARAAQAVYPGARGVATVTSADLLQVDMAAFGDLLESSIEVPPLYETIWLTEGWESRFLGGHLLQQLRPCQWQRLLRGLRPTTLTAGEVVVCEGETGKECYVLCSGSAEVWAAGRCLARVGPGDLFGEDALITGAARNASVIMTADGAVRALPDDLFRMLLLPLRVAAERAGDRPVRLDIGKHASGVGLHVPIAQLRERLGEMQEGVGYWVVGGNPGQRTLAAFILSQHGLHVAGVAD